jgi:hypothetical protein
MKILARALVNAAAFLDLADEEEINPALAEQALEEIAYNLSHCTPEEVQTLREVLDDMKAAERENEGRPEMLEFLDTFLVSFGVVGDEDDPEDPDLPDDRRINLL